MNRSLKTILDNLYEARSQAHLNNDPLSFCHRYQDPKDQEVAGLIAASFAYGNVKIILRNLERIFSAIGPEPRRFVERFEPRSGLALFSGFKHRFNDSRDLCALLLAVRQMLTEADTIESFFLKGFAPDTAGIAQGMEAFAARILAMDYAPVFGTGGIPKDSYFPFFFPSPAGGSACKRLCMYLRWMVRPADGIDLGIWQGLSPAQLIIPVDAHIHRIGRYLGFTQRRQADWKAAQEITAALALLDPQDPVKYDFSICHLGISEGCGKSGRNACLSCDIAGICSGITKN
ncbi:TIGR02757 family protein [Geobacter pelophilus]|uniref:TIGR02757 family protein n=1 Tax=Geoanaerobacter pelophilus TaxID=60036 RepID=A0AAW4L3T5_9BACT|nr:TIGR02757 family protein [Geoanaerobacter pelophilus]MBT0665399.1 TIGR02757 family protein [Geoanaerobacter pelophilus]